MHKLGGIGTQYIFEIWRKEECFDLISKAVNMYTVRNQRFS